MAKSIEDNFADWEGATFGFGYGSGEEHVIPALRAFLKLCPNGDLHHAYDYDELERELTPQVAWLLINALCRADILEYGTSPRYGWLTPQGEALKSFVLQRSTERLVELATSREEASDVCYPDACNCDGYEKGKICVNPFWRGHSAEEVARKVREQGELTP